jgi:ribonuclease P protein component
LRHRRWCGGAPLARMSRAPREQLTFPAHRRLRHKSEFETAYARGRRFGNGFFGVTVISNDKSGPRLGMAVALRVTRTAVERNRIRRIIRESFRTHQHMLPPVDVVVGARARAPGASAHVLRTHLEPLWRQVSERCVLSPLA